MLDTGLYLSSGYSVVQFCNAGGECTRGYQIQFNLIVNILEQRNSFSENDRVHEQPISVDHIQLHERMRCCGTAEQQNVFTSSLRGTFNLIT